jgi:hemoglobin
MICRPTSLDGNTCCEVLIPSVTPFEALGGAEGVRALVHRFYDLVESAPEAAALRRVHGPSLDSAREKLTLYLTGWTGGPPVYVERYGHPMLRARHLPFSIGAQERDEWLWCMEHALAEHDMPDEVRQFLMTKLRPLADHMRNRADGS